MRHSHPRSFRRAGDPPAAAVPPGRRPAVHRRPHRRRPRGRAGRRRRVAGPDLLPARHPVGVPRPGAQPRPLLPGRRRPPDRPPGGPRAAAVLGPDRGLLPGPPAAARGVLLRRGVLGRPRPGRQGRPGVAVEGAAGVPVRRDHGHHARHPGEPGRLPAGVQPGAGPRVPDRPPRGGDLAGVRGGREPRVLPVRRQGAGRGQPAPPAVGRARPRRRPAGRPADRQLGEHRTCSRSGASNWSAG